MQLEHPQPHFSLSSLQKFDNCPFSYMMRYVAGIKLPQTDKMKLGDQFQQALNAKYSGGDPAPLIKEMDPKMRGAATILISKANEIPKEEIISLDKPYDLDLGFGIPLKFIPDVLLKDRIIENKFTTGYYNPKMVQTERQRVVYYLGVRKLFNFDPKVYYQLFNTKKLTCELIETPVTLQDIDELMDWINLKLKQIDHSMRTGIWSNGSEHLWCDYPETCPIMEKYGRNFKKK